MQTVNSVKRPIQDLIYSFAAYALPTFMLQFIIFPLIAGRLSSEDNGLFLALFNAVRLCVSLFIVPLANVRLLKKKECIAEPNCEKSFNFLFLIATGISAALVFILGLFYYRWTFEPRDLILLIAVLLLLSAHDYYSITFRIHITYKCILFDNLMIVSGYLVGIGLMLLFGYWELIFICGYACGLLYTLWKSKMWRSGVTSCTNKETVTQYSQLCVSSGLNNATTYCDKMLIYPLIGGYSVSVYNAAAVVSKLMSLISVPLRNVFLSYIVDVDKILISKRKQKQVKLLIICGTGVIYGCFYVASVILCRILYPQYFDAALRCIPIILLAILFETYAGLLKVYLLRFEKTILQVRTSCMKVILYLLCVLVMNVVCDLGLKGFCISILIADCVHFVVVLLLFIKNLKNGLGKDNDVS